MVIRLREAPSSRLDFYIVSSVFVFLVFGKVSESTGDWMALAFSAVGGLSTLWLGRLRLRLFFAARRRAAVDEAAPMAPETRLAPPAAERAFVSRATHSVSGRFREGYVVMGREAAAFVPTSDWRLMALELVMGLVASRVSLSKLEIDANESPDLARELDALVQHRDGLMLDGSWSWLRRGLMLSRSEGRESIRIDDTPPEAGLGRWAALPANPVAARRLAGRVALVALLVAALLSAGGGIAAAVTGDSDYVVAGLVYGVLIGGAAAVPFFLMHGARRSPAPGPARS